MSKFNSPAFKLIVLVSWFWMTCILVGLNVFLNKGLLAERARNDRLEKNIEEIEKQYPNSEVLLKLK